MSLLEPEQSSHESETADNIGFYDIAAFQPAALYPLGRIQIKRIVEQQKKWYKKYKYHHIYFRRQNTYHVGIDGAYHDIPCDEIRYDDDRSIQHYLEPVKMFLIILDQISSPLAGILLDLKCTLRPSCRQFPVQLNIRQSAKNIYPKLYLNLHIVLQVLSAKYYFFAFVTQGYAAAQSRQILLEIAFFCKKQDLDQKSRCKKGQVEQYLQKWHILINQINAVA